MTSRLLLVLYLVLNLQGCATLSEGNYSKAPDALNKTISTDTVNRLVSLYPPASTRFHIKQNVKDHFGLSLVESLRQKGYSIDESSTSAASTKGTQNVTLNYVVDEPIKGTLYRITLRVGQQSLSRAYRIKKGTLTPSGFWVRKE